MQSRRKKPPPDSRILKLREYEENHRTLVHAKNEHQKVTSLAEWERVTDNKIKKNTVTGRFHHLRAEAERKLEERRDRLRDLLAAEEAALQYELQRSEVTPEERRAMLERRALDLKSRREAERQAVAEEALFRSWRESCDDVRLSDSKALTMRAVDGRKSQVDEKAARRAREAEEKCRIEEVMEQERVKKEQRFLADKARRKELDTEAVEVLNEQLEAVARMNKQVEEMTEKEVAEMKARWQAEDEEWRAHERALRERKKAIGQELLSFNEASKALKAQQLAEQRAYDSAMIQTALKKEKEEEQREREMRDKQREEERMYRHHLQLLMQKEQVDERERDALIKAAEDAEWAKREATWKREEEARRRLMQEVDKERQRQLAAKAHRREDLEAEQVRERERFAAEFEALQIESEERSRQDREAKARVKMELEAQIGEKEAREHLKKDQVRIEAEAAQAKQTQYHTMVLKATAQKPAEPYFGRKTAKWFH